MFNEQDHGTISMEGFNEKSSIGTKDIPFEVTVY
jgi:hypothetical protein